MKRRGPRVNCMICGFVNPISHVIIYQRMRVAGRICGMHTLQEVIQNTTPEFDVRIRLVTHMPTATLDELSAASKVGLEAVREYVDTHDVSDIWDVLEPG